MSHLFDTNVVSEQRRPKHRADSGVRSWIAGREESELYLSVITILGIQVGINRLAGRDSTQAKRLQEWLEDAVLEVFAGRILPVDVSVARRCASLHVPAQDLNAMRSSPPRHRFMV